MSTLSVHRIENVQDFDFANTPFVTAFNAANGAYAVSNSALATANAFANTANAAFGVANAAYNAANNISSSLSTVALTGNYNDLSNTPSPYGNTNVASYLTVYDGDILASNIITKNTKLKYF